MAWREGSVTINGETAVGYLQSREGREATLESGHPGLAPGALITVDGEPWRVVNVSTVTTAQWRRATLTRSTQKPETAPARVETFEAVEIETKEEDDDDDSKPAPVRSGGRSKRLVAKAENDAGGDGSD